MKRNVIWAGAGLWLCASGPLAALPEANSIEFNNCALSMPGTPVTASARCGFIEVPEDYAHPDGRRIPIHVAVAEATGTDIADDPLFFFAGGPGQAASETWVMIRNSLRKVRKHRDIVMIDQRGTGRSNKLQCEVEESADLLNAEVDFQELADRTRSCLRALDADTRQYTTSIAVRDVDRVRQAMGYERINVMGVSYGTRAAQVYLRAFPDTVRSMTLDSVVPMQLALGQEHAPMLDRAVARVLGDCARDPVCGERFPDPGHALAALFEQLREAPRTITITEPVTGQPLELRLGADTLAVALRFLSYSSETQALLPLLVHEAVTTGNLDRLASQALLVLSGLNEMIARGMELSVMCAEDYPFMDPGTDHADTLMGNLMLQGIHTQCEAWEAGEAPPGFHDPVSSPVPVLLMSGERDPVTPPSYAARAAEGFPNHLELVARGQSHSVLRNVCLQDVAARFIELGSVDGIDTACVDAIAPAPFFTSLLGPRP